MASELNGFRYVFLPYNDFMDGTQRFGVVCKRTYSITPGERAKLDSSQLDLNSGDVHWEESQPLMSSIKYESDFVPCKPKTDVVVNARAYAPGGRPIDQMTTSVEVEGVGKKEVLVIGDRFCLHRVGSSPQFSRPRPFQEIPLRYEYAYGGWDAEASPDGGIPYAKNTVGVGFAVGGPNAADSVDRMPLPNLEDPKNRLLPHKIIVPPDKMLEAPEPAGFGWFNKGWVPRAMKAGVPDAHREVYEAVFDLEALEEKGALIKSFEMEFFNGASPGLILPYLHGNEWLELRGMTPESVTPGGELRFGLPRHGVEVKLDLGDGVQSVEMNLTTVSVLVEDLRVYLCWSGNLEIESLLKVADKGIHKLSIEPTIVA